MNQHNLFNSFRQFEVSPGRKGGFYSLPALEEAGLGPVSRLPVCLRIILESVLRNCDGKKVEEHDIRALASWKPTGPRTEEIPFIVARIVLQDFTGVPLLVDLAAMRSAAAHLGKDPKIVEPLVPVDLVVDHSVQVDFAGSQNALRQNMELEFKRNNTRYQFLKWGMQAFKSFKVVPPGIGIVHQVNLEHLSKGVLEREGTYYPDTLVGTDSHTTMINGLGIVGWGVGGIEAEAGMLGQPVYFLTPDVVGVHLTGKLGPGVTATDLALTVTQILRRTKVVGKFVEFYGPGAAALEVVDRATVANMAPEYGATIGFFPFDEKSCHYFTATGRPPEQAALLQNYYTSQGIFGMPQDGDCDYSSRVNLNLAEVEPSIAGPKRPQDRINLGALAARFQEIFQKPVSENGYNKPLSQLTRRYATSIGVAGELTHPIMGGGQQGPETVPVHSPIEPGTSHKNTSTATEREMINNRPTPDRVLTVPLGEFPEGMVDVGHGDVLIAAITSCTNTSNPAVMLAAGLVAKKAVERGLEVRPTVKASLAPGSRVVTEYLNKTGLQPYLDRLGFYLVGYGCTTCIGNSGPLDPRIEDTVGANDLIAAAVLSGNRNFEARIHQGIKANFLMSPPLVVAFALAGRVNIDLTREPLATDREGQPVYLRDLWPSPQEIQEVLKSAFSPETFRRLYQDFTAHNPLWNDIPSPAGDLYAWDPHSTYIQEPPFFHNFSLKTAAISEIHHARPLAIFGDSVTTDHISPAGAIKATSPSGIFLLQQGVPVEDFNSYGARRGNDRVMTRGTFANVRIKNLMVPGVEGGVTIYQPDGQRMTIYEAALKYEALGVPLLVFAGHEYGTGSSRDWAAKGTRLLGVKAVIAESFERIHRSNLLGMGVLPLQFKEGISALTLALDGSETFDILGLDARLKPQQDLILQITRDSGAVEKVPVLCRIDTPVEVDYYQHGGILPFVLRQLVTAVPASS